MRLKAGMISALFFVSFPLLASSLAITTSSLPGATVGTAYGETLAATGGRSPYTWSLASGSLPPGLSLSTSKGVIWGTPTASGTYSFVVRVKDSATYPATAIHAESIAIAAKKTSSLVITTSSLPNGIVGAAYSATLSASGGIQPYTWTLTSGQLPTGLSLGATSGSISRIPTATGTYTFTIQVKGHLGGTASRSYTVSIDSPVGIITTSLPNGVVKVAYNVTLCASGGTPPYSWSLASGSLPAGLLLSTSGAISGAPTTAGTSSFTVMVKDSASSPHADTQAESIVVAASSSTISPPPQASGYNLVFSDDFTSLDLSPNSYGNYTWYNPGMFWQKPAPYSNIAVGDSAVTLTWTSGQSPANTSIATAAKNGSYYRAWRYGYFEARMKWDAVTGSWPAFWMMPVQGITCGKCEEGELDIFEGQGTSGMYYGTIHDWYAGGGQQQNSPNYHPFPSGTDVTQYHTYGVLWVPGYVTWYFDNQEMGSAPTYSIFDQQNYYLILGSQEGVNWSYGNTRGVTASSISISVDWVHVWQHRRNTH